MISNGLKLKFTDHHDLDLIKNFGTFDSTQGLPASYIVNTTKDMPDQVAVGLYEGCTAFAQIELASDQTGEQYDVGEFYASTPPGGTSGRAMRDSLKLLVKRGPKTLEQKLRPWNGAYYNVYKQGVFDWFDACRVGLFIVRNEKRAVTAAMPWYPHWTPQGVGKDGIVPDLGAYSWTGATAHNAIIAGWTDTGIVSKQPLGGTYLALKSWQGKTVGDGGWLYFSRPIINKVFDLYYTEMFTASQQKPTQFLTVDLPAVEMVISFIRNLLHL